MKILLTGGTGLIGRALCEALLAGDHQPIVLTRSGLRASRLLGSRVTVIEHLAEAAPPEAVVNLCGENLSAGRWSNQRKHAFWTSRVDATHELVAWMRRLETPPAVLVSGSAVGYYGPHGDDDVTEDTANGTDFGAKLCAAWEEEARGAETLGVRVCRLRTGLVLTPEGGALAKMLPAFRLGLGGPAGSGKQYISWIERGDLVALILRLILDPKLVGPINGTAPNPVTNRELTATLGRVLRRPALLRAPAAVLHLALGEMADLLLQGQRVRPKRALAAGFSFRFPDLETALSHLLHQA
jgi:hypothetical protein